MASVARSRFFRRCLALFSLGSALLVGCYGILLFAEAFDGHGSPVGNFLLFGLGLFLLVLSIIVLIVGFRIWRSARTTRAGAFR
jgi:hypothetical protein